jgi:hypothetical protein
MVGINVQFGNLARNLLIKLREVGLVFFPTR